jgi:glycosyltransferase involved in cell wall biosynthesis
MGDRSKQDGTVKGLVSVVIPTYNAADFACAAVESCLSQTYRPVEIIVVDDGSTDGTRQRLQPFIDKNLIKYIYQENGERSRARNRGIMNAVGEYIQFLDVDDLLEPDKLEKQVAFLEADPGCFGVYCAAAHFGEVEQRFQRPHPVHTGEITRSNIKGNFILINTMLTRRSEVLFDEKLNTLEDWDYWFRISLNRRRFGYIGQELCRVRRHSGNTSKDGLAMLQGELAVLNKMAAAGVFPGDVKYYTFERMFLLGAKGYWTVLLDSIAGDGRNIFRCLVFLAKSFVRRVLKLPVNNACPGLL